MRNINECLITSPEEETVCEMADIIALQDPHPLSLQYEVVVAVGAIIVTQPAGYREMVLVAMLHSTTITEVTAAVLVLAAMLCCHHSNILPRLACSKILISFVYFLHWVCKPNFCIPGATPTFTCSTHIVCFPSFISYS
jgi:hypothetical protein